jgi:hypothetical protein
VVLSSRAGGVSKKSIPCVFLTLSSDNVDVDATQPVSEIPLSRRGTLWGRTGSIHQRNCHAIKWGFVDLS